MELITLEENLGGFFQHQVHRIKQWVKRRINKNLAWQNYVYKKLETELKVVDILELTPNLDETFYHYNFVNGANLYPIDFPFLKALAKKYNVKRFLEIGTLCGTTVANMAEICEECVTIDLPVEDIKKKRSIRYINEGMARFSKNLPNVKHINQDSRTVDFSKLGKFDFVFIDGNHHYEAVLKDTQNALKVLNKGGIIVWHGYFVLFGDIAWEIFAGMLDGTPKEMHEKMYGVSDTACAIYTGENFKTQQRSYPPEVPDKEFTVHIKAQKL